MRGCARPTGGRHGRISRGPVQRGEGAKHRPRERGKQNRATNSSIKGRSPASIHQCRRRVDAYIVRYYALRKQRGLTMGLRASGRGRAKGRAISRRPSTANWIIRAAARKPRPDRPRPRARGCSYRRVLCAHRRDRSAGGLRASGRGKARGRAKCDGGDQTKFGAAKNSIRPEPEKPRPANGDGQDRAHALG
jgi:hypothetical protein